MEGINISLRFEIVVSVSSCTVCRFGPFEYLADNYKCWHQERDSDFNMPRFLFTLYFFGDDYELTEFKWK